MELIWYFVICWFVAGGMFFWAATSIVEDYYDMNQALEAAMAPAVYTGFAIGIVALFMIFGEFENIELAYSQFGNDAVVREKFLWAFQVNFWLSLVYAIIIWIVNVVKLEPEGGRSHFGIFCLSMFEVMFAMTAIAFLVITILVVAFWAMGRGSNK